MLQPRSARRRTRDSLHQQAAADLQLLELISAQLAGSNAHARNYLSRTISMLLVGKCKYAVLRQRSTLGADKPGGNAIIKAEWRAYRHHPFAHPELVGRPLLQSANLSLRF
jgi:hypothetical protein